MDLSSDLTNLNVQSFARRFGNRAEAQSILDLLQKQIAYLPGGKGFNNGPLVVLPQHQLHKNEDVITVLKYLGTIPSESSIKRGVTIIINNQKKPQNQINSLIMCCQDAYGSALNRILILHDQENKIEIDSNLSQKIKIDVVSRDILRNMINYQHLPIQLGGIYEYDHVGWVNSRIFLESYSKAVKQRLDLVDTLTVRVFESLFQNNGNQRNSIYGQELNEGAFMNPEMRAYIQELRQNSGVARKELKTLMSKGYSYLEANQLRSNESYEEDQFVMNTRVEKLLKSMEERLHRLGGLWKKKVEEGKVVGNIKEMEISIRNVVDFILGPCDKILSSQWRVGRNLQEADEIRRQHEQLEIKCIDSYGKYAELTHKLSQVLDSNECNQEKKALLQMQFTEMDRVCKDFACRLEARRTVVVASVRLYKLISQISKLLLELGNHLKLLLTDKTLQDYFDALNRLSDELVNVCNLSTQEAQNLKEYLNTQAKYIIVNDTIASDWRDDMHEIDSKVSEIQGDVAAMLDMVEEKKLEVEQKLHLKSCLQNVDEAIEYLEELNELMKNDANEDALKDLPTLEKSQKEFDKAEKTAHKSYELGQKNIQAAYFLCKNSETNSQLLREREMRLREAWAKFHGVFQEARLQAVTLFNIKSDQFLSEVDQILIRVDNRQNGKEMRRTRNDSLPGKVKHLKHYHQQLHQDALNLNNKLTSRNYGNQAGEETRMVENMKEKLAKVYDRMNQLTLKWANMPSTKQTSSREPLSYEPSFHARSEAVLSQRQENEAINTLGEWLNSEVVGKLEGVNGSSLMEGSSRTQQFSQFHQQLFNDMKTKDRVTKVTLTGLLKQQWDCLFDVLQARVIYASVVQDYYSTFNQATEVLEASKRTTFNNEEELFSVLRSLENQEEALNQSTIAVFKTPIDQNDDTLDIQAIESFIKQQTNAWKQSKEEWLMSLYNSHKKMPVEDNIIRNTYGDEKYKVEEKVGKSDSIGKPLNRLQHKTEKVTHDLKESEQYADIMNSDFNDTTVQKPLKITNGLANQVVSEGKPVEFSVIVTGNPRPIVTWYLNGKEIKNSPDFIIESNGDEYTLKIPEVFNEDRGLYSVSAKNKHSQVNDQARLQVSAPITERQKSISLDNEIATKLDPNGAAKTHPTFSKKLQDTTLDVGDDVILECALPLFPVPDKAKWYKDGVEVDKKIPAIRTSSRHGVHRLVIEKAKKVHSGRYACKTIVDGAVVLTEMTLKINDPSEQYYENTVAQGNNGNQFINGNVSHNYYQQQNTSIPVPPPMKPVEIDPKFSKSSAPKVISGFGKVQLNPNHSVLLQCRVVGEPLPNIQWFKDGRPIRPTTATNKHVLRYNNHTGDCSLTINMATIQDVGHYECVALNKVGRDKCEGDVVFEEGHEVDTTSYLDPHALKRIMTNRPTILGQKEDVYSGVSEVYVEPRFIGTNEDDTVQACIGETVKLSNKITGQPHPDVTWLKDGVEMEKSDRWQVVVNQENVHSLVIKNLKDKDAGVYTCRASNRAGKTTKDVLLVVEENKLNFVSAGHMQSNVRQSATLKDGDDEVSNLKSFASDSSKKKMSNKQSEFQNSLQNEIKNFKSTSNLAPVIPNTKTLPTEVPVVSVLSENHNKESFKEPEPSAPVFMILPSSAIVDEGGRVKFCTKVSGNPVPNVAWSINNLDVFSSSRINVYHDGLMNVLEILKAKKYDHGEVKVLARNYVGSQEHTVSLTVKEPFDFRSKLHPSDNTENKVANNQIISHKESRSDSLPALTSIEARKLTAPLFVEELKDIEVDDGDSLKLCCVVVGHPSPVISWFRNDKDVNMLEDYSFKYDLKTGLCSLLISDCMPDDSGNFVCLAKNNHGLAKTSCFLKVKDSNKKQLKVTKSESLQSSRRLSFNDLKQMLKSNKIEMNKQFKTPKFLKELFDKEVTDGTQASFEVEYDGLPTPSIEWFFKEDLIKPSSDFFIETDNEKQYSKLTIMEIFLDDEGVYRCKATNLMGSASTSCHMKVKDNFKEQSINNETNVLEALKVLEAINMNGSLKETEIENKSFSETISMSSNKSSLRSSPVPSCPSPFSTTTKSSEVHFRTTPVFKKATLELTVPEIISKKEIFLKRTIGLVPNSRQESFMDVSQHRSFSETQITFDKTLSPKINQNDQSTKPLVHKVKTPDSVRKKRRIEAVKRKNSINQMKKDAIKTPPIILKALPTELKVTDGQSFDLFFYVKPLAIQQIITWYFNDKVLNDNPDMETFYDEVNGESILRFFEIFPQDSGIYKCVIQNEHGQVSTSANVIVEDPKFSKIYATEKDQTENNEFFPAQEIPIEVSEIVEIQNNDVEKEIMLHKEEVKEIVNDKIPTLELSQNTQAFEEVPAQTIGKKLNKVDETTQNNESRLENELLKTMEVNEALKNPSTATVSFVEKHTFTSNKSFIQNLVNMVAYTSKQKFQTLLPLKNKESKIENLNFAEVLETCLMSKISQIDYTFKYCCLKLFFMPQENSVNKLSPFKMPICEELTLESHYDEASENSPESFDISNFEKAGKILAMKTTKKKIPKVLPKPTEKTENPITTNHIDNEKKNFEKVNSASTGKVIDLFFDCKEFGECQNENSAKFSITKSLPSCLELLESHALKLECHFVNLPSDSSIIWLKDNKEIKKDSRLKIETSKNRTILEIDSLTKRDDALYEVSLKSSSATLKSESRVLVESLKKDSEKDNSNGVVNSLKTQLANRKEVSETQDKPIATISQTARAEDNTDSKSYFSGNVLSQLEAMKKTKYFESPELDKIKVVEEKAEKKKIAETKKQEASPTENSQVKQQNNKLINNKKIKETSNLVDFSPSELSVTSSENTSEFQTKTETETTTKSPQKIRKSSEISVKDKIAEKFNKKPIDELKNGNNKNKTSVEKIGNKDKSKDGREQKYVSTLTEEITYKDESKTSSKELEPPSILAKPKSQFVNENEDATFTCKFKGGFTLQIFWLKEKQPIKPDNHINIVANEDSSGSIISKLSVKNCSLEDSGKYTVGAFGADGSSVDCTISLNVKASPKKMDFKMNLKKKEPFKKVEKKVEIERQTNIEETVNRKQMHSHTESSSLADNKRTTKTPAQLKEEQNQLYIVKKLQDIIVYEGETARFDCLISKFWPKQTVSWFFQNKPIESGEYYKKIENSEEKSVCLEVYEVHVDDAGLYTVRVSNDHGVVESSCFLKVEESTYEESFQTGPVLKKDDENMLSNQKSQQNAAQTSKPTNSLSKLGQQNSNQQNQQKNLQQKLNVFNGKKPENKNNEKVIHENTNKNGVSKTNKPDVTENKTNGLNISQKPNVLVQNKNDFSSSNEKAAKDQKASKSHNRSEAKQLVDKIKFEETCDYVLCQLKTENFQKDVEEEIIKVSIAVDLKASESKENIHCRNAEEEQNIQALEKIRLASEYQNVYLESFLKIDFLKNAILSLSFIKTNTLKISKKIFLNETFNLVSKSFQEDYKIQNFEVAVQSTVSEDEKVTENYLFKGETILNEIATISGTEVDLKAISDVSVDFYVSETTSETERENYIESISELYLSLAPQIDESSFPSNDICTGYYESVQNNIVFTIVLIESVSISNELVDRAFTEVFVDKTEENIGHDTFKTIDSDKYLTVDGVLIEKIETNKVAFTDYLILLVLAPICYTIITHEINSQIEELKKKEKKAKLKTLHDLETYKTDRSQTDSETASLSEIVKILESKEADFEQKHSKIKETFIAKQDFSQIKMGIFESTIEQTIENVLQAGINLINENSLNELNQNSEKKITSEVVLNAIDNTNTINYKASCVLNTLPVGDFSTFTIKELKARCVGIDVMIIANDCLKKNKCEITQKFSEIKSKEDIIKIKKVEELLIDKDSPLMLKKDIGFVIKKKPASFSAKKCISDDINTKEPLDKKEVEETCMFKPASSNQTRPDAILDELHKINATKKETNLKLENESFKKKNEEKFMVEKKAKNARNISQTNSSKSQKSHEIATVEKPIIKPVVNFSEKTEVQKVISQVLYKGKNLNHASNILNTLSIEEQEKSKGFERIAVINGHENIVHRKQQNRRPIFQQNMDVSLNVGSSTNITIPFVSESSNTLKIIWVKLKKLKATEGVLTIEKTVQNFREKSQKLDSFADINTQDYEIDEKAKLEYETTTNETFMVLKNVQRHRDDGLYEARLTDEFGEARCLVRVSVKENPCSPENLRLHLLEKSASKLHLTKKKEFNVLLTWDPPIDDGGDQIMNYIIERLDGPTETWVYCITISSERTQIKIPASLFFKSIAFRVAAQNKCGIGNFSNPSENILNISKGTNIPPWFVRKFPVKMEVREGTPMNFFCSSNSETSDSSSYAFKDTDSMYDKQSFASSNSTLDNLDFLSESIPFFEDTIPCAPSNLIVEPAGDSNKEVLARWWPPKNLNEKMLKTISGYILEKRVIGEDDWKVLAKLPFDVMECEIGDLAKNKKYVLRVAVEMKDGETCPSRELCEPFEIDDTHGTIVGCVPPKPNQPIVLEDLDGDNSCKVEWKVEISELSKSSQIDVILFEENKKTTDKPNSVLHYIVERKETRGPQRFKVIQQIVKSPPLVVEDLEEEVEYEFKVLACNTSGNSAPSDPSKPFVFRSKDEKAVRFIKKLKDQIVKVNECAVFECKVVGNPLPKIKWFKNFSEIFSDARHEIVTKKDTGESCFLILNVKEEDCGEVECRAFNPLLTTSSRATLNVHIPPKLRTSSKTFENLQFVGGTKVKARIPLSSNPFPTVEWFKAGELITESERISFEKDEHSVTLCIKDSTKEDSGAYAVKVKNYLGIDQVEFDITVTGKPAKLQTPPKVTKVSDSSCKLEWLECSDNGGSPIVEYILEISDDKDVQNWKTVGKSNTTKSEIKGLAPNRTYTFAVRAKNIFGLSERSPPSEAISLKKLRLQQSSLYDKYVKSGCERNQIDVSRLKCETALSSKYKIYEEISRGPFGAMHRAEDRVSGDSWLARFVMTTPLDKMLLKQEISIINNLRHPNILVLQDAYETDGEIASIFELLSGPDLLTRLADESQCRHTELKRIEYMKQICNAIKYLHENNLLHLDIKPETIIFETSSSKKLKLCGLGSTKLLVADRCTKVYHSSVNHLPPEILKFSPVSFASDMWSLGILAFNIISGKHLVPGKTVEEVSENILSNHDLFSKACIAKLLKEASDHCHDWISRCLVKDSHKRMTINEALCHSWLNGDAEKELKDQQLSSGSIESLNQLLSQLDRDNDVIAIGFLAHEGEDFLRIANNSKDFERDITMELPDQAPAVMTELSNSEVYEGSVARFKCKFQGRPDPTVEWYHENKKLEEETSKLAGMANIMSKWGFWSKNGVAMLSINDVTEEDAGTYECKASNSLGCCSTSGELSVQTFSWKARRSRRSVSVKSNGDDDDLMRMSLPRDSVNPGKS